MNVISVNASQNYDVIVGTSILADLGEHAAKLCGKCNAAIISDSNVFPIYGELIKENLQQAGIPSFHYVFPAGEESKNLQTYSAILNFLAENNLSRSDLIIALGGGVVGDIAGFAAATYLRGIAYIQVPTSLLAMVDSSVGGKTAIDIPAGKNLVGAFKQPSLVLCDVSVLSTLPRNVFLDGCAEVIKYSILYDADLFAYLQKTGASFDPEWVIAKCISFKAAVVQADEFDTGLRQKLNFGHTIGHGIESLSNYKVTHGQAVATGMAVITNAAVRNGLCDESVLDALNHILQQFTLPSRTIYAAEALFQSSLSDKKRTGDFVNLIIPKKIGKCDIIQMPVSKLKSFIEAGL